MSLWMTFGKTVLAPILTHAPRFLLQRWYPESTLAQETEVDLAARGGLSVLNTTVPSLVGNLHIVNHLPFGLIITKGTLDISLGQPIAAIPLSETVTIPAHSSKDIYFKELLSDAQFRCAKATLNRPESSWLYINGTIEADVGFSTFKKTLLIERNGHDLLPIARYRPAPTYEEPVQEKQASQ